MARLDDVQKWLERGVLTSSKLVTQDLLGTEQKKKKPKAMGHRHTFWMVSGKVLKAQIPNFHSASFPEVLASALIRGLMIDGFEFCDTAPFHHCRVWKIQHLLSLTRPLSSFYFFSFLHLSIYVLSQSRTNFFLACKKISPSMSYSTNYFGQ